MALSKDITDHYELEQTLAQQRIRLKENVDTEFLLKLLFEHSTTLLVTRYAHFDIDGLGIGST
jgi:glutamine phosphoribosylpyrophosphate amidotransferase